MKNKTVSAERKEKYLKNVEEFNQLLIEAAELDSLDIIETVEKFMFESIVDKLLPATIQSMLSFTDD